MPRSVPRNCAHLASWEGNLEVIMVNGNGGTENQVTKGDSDLNGTRPVPTTCICKVLLSSYFFIDNRSDGANSFLDLPNNGAKFRLFSL